MYFRRRARILALQILFANEFLHEQVDQVSERIAQSLQSELPDFTQTLVQLVSEHDAELTHLIKTHLRNWDFERISILDRVIIKIALAEILFLPDIPPEVSINEALEISKQFSSEKSKRFINGILDSIYKELLAQGKLQKQPDALKEDRCDKKSPSRKPLS